MTQQAGVSAEAVAKLVEKWRERGNELANTPSTHCHTEGMRLQLCADELEALATAPPEQAKEKPCKQNDIGSVSVSQGLPGALAGNATAVASQSEVALAHSAFLKAQPGYYDPSEPSVIHERIVSQEQLDQSIAEIADALPQPVSAGALSAEQIEIALALLRGRLRTIHLADTFGSGNAEVVKRLAELENTNDQARQYIQNAQQREHRINELEAALAAHDQKVRAEVLEPMRAKLRGLCIKIECSIDGFLDGKPYILTYSDIHAEIEAALASGAEEKETK